MKFSFYIIVLLVSISFSTFAQGIGDEEITITKDRNVELQKANRVYEKIPTEKRISKKREMTYEFFEEKPSGVEEIDFSPSIIAPVESGRKRGDQNVGYANYIKVGVGNFGRFYGEAFVNSDQSQDLVFGLYGLHNGASRGPIEGKNSSINIDQFKVSGKYHSQGFELAANIGYELRNYNFFGYDTLNYELTKSELKQRLNIINVGFSFENTNPDPVIDYVLKTNIRSLNDHFAAEEIDWGTQFEASFPIIKDRITGIIAGEAYVTQRKDNYFVNPVRKRNLFIVEPSFNINYNQFNAKIGFKAVNEYDQVLDVNTSKGFPMVNLTYKTPSLYYFFAGFDGDVIRNTLGSLLDENPWLKPQVEVKSTVKEQEFYIGSRGDLISGLNYNFKAAYGKFSNLYFFNTYDGDPKTRQFEVFYESNETEFLNISAEFNYEANDFWRTNLSADYWFYETIDFEYAYHKPAIQARLGNTFLVSDKIVSSIDFYYIGSSYAHDPFLVEDIKLKAIADLNASFTYLFSEQFAVFINLNNIIGKNYQRYLNYPQQGLNFLAGINVSL